MTNAPMSNEGAGDRQPEFDLEERTARFGETVIAFAKRIPVNPVTTPLISQLVRAATSVGANYCEADEAESGKEFRYRIGVLQARVARDEAPGPDGRGRRATTPRRRTCHLAGS